MKYLLSLIVLSFAIPLGFFLKKITKEELKQGRKYFGALWKLSLILGIGMMFFEVYLGFGFLFISVVSFISWKNE